jgi:flagellar basal-body rod modification protein FlgD
MSVERGSYEDYAVMDGVRVNIAGVVTTTPSTDPDFIKNYLSANKGKAVSVNIVDRSTGQSVPVSATLNDYTVAADGTITAVLDQVAVPVDSIASLKKS